MMGESENREESCKLSSPAATLDFDELVRRIGDAILQRLGHAPADAANGACGCQIKEPRAVVAPTPDVRGWIAPEGGLAAIIDHTLLRPDATKAEITKLCAEARQHGFGAVCVQPSWVAHAARELAGSAVRAVSVVGFPHGATVTPVKREETEQLIRLGAHEVDMVAHIGALRAGDLDHVHTDIAAVVAIARRARAAVKVILEMGLLNEEQKINGCVVAMLAGAGFVKTSTGFGPSGADANDVALMHRIVGGRMGIKAAGGIRSFAHLREMMAAGATRIGTSSGITILAESGASAGL